MALFIDGPASSIEDLQGHDTQLTDVANVEGIDVTRKLALAQEEISLELTALLDRLKGPQSRLTMMGPGIGQVVVTPPLKLWHTFRSLELVYRDAYNSQLNDRYAGRRDEYHELAKWAYEKLIQNGIGVAQDPIPQAAGPILTAAPGVLADGTYYVAVSWTNQAGEEGASSRPVTITTASCTFAVRPASAPSNAAGWNVYAGVSPTGLVLQNTSPVALDGTWTQQTALVMVGTAASAGQAPNYMRPAPQILQRG